MFLVTKRFTAGLLAGLTITERTSVRFAVGQVVAKPAGGSSPFVVVAVKEEV